MNTFANSLFSLLFGWAKGLIQRVWTGAARGEYGGFFVWLGDHWIWLAVLLCIAGTALDFMIWMIRWRPYLAWRTSVRRLAHRLHPETVESNWRFRRGFEGGVALDIPEGPEQPYGPQEEWDQPADSQPAPEPADMEPEDMPYDEPQPVYTAPSYGPVEGQVVYADGQTEYMESSARQRADAPLQPYEDSDVFAFGDQDAVPPGDQPAPRRRRSDKHTRRMPSWADRLINGDENEDRLLDGLPPAVNREDAFHEPVYPRRDPAPAPGPYAAWQRPGNNPTDGQNT